MNTTKKTEQEKREKVIKGLKSYAEALAYAEKMMAEGKIISTDPQVRGDRIRLLCDALDLLKAQEPREPHYTRLEYTINGMPVVVQHPECPKCVENGLMLWDAEIARGVKFCKRCGQEVKWDD